MRCSISSAPTGCVPGHKFPRLSFADGGRELSMNTRPIWARSSTTLMNGLKLESEIRLKRACAQLGTELRIFRPSIVTGAAPATMGGVPSNLLLTFVRLLGSLGRTERAKTCHVRIRGLPHARFNIVPVEYVARAIAELAEEPQASGKTFHLVTDDPPTQAEILNMLSAFLSQGSASCRTGRTDLQSVIRRVEDCKAAASLQRLFGTGRSLRFFRRAPVAQQSRCADARDRSPRSGSSHPARVILQQAMACEFGLGRPQEKRLTDFP